MIEKLLQENIQEFIRQHANDDEQKLLLRQQTIFDVPASAIAWQIAGRRKAKIKIPLYYNTVNIVYPPGVNLEQSSSEQTAAFKASVLSEQSSATNSIIDLTGGFGIDSYFFSKKFDRITYVEPNSELLDYAKHNHTELGGKNIRHVNSTAEEFLKSLTDTVDCFYIDPSRRSASNNKVFKLSDCEPNVVTLLPEIFRRANYLMIKAAPLLDVQQALRELIFVKHVWVVSVSNEVKELLLLCEKDYKEQATITAVNLDSDQPTFTFQLADEQKAKALFSNPLAYLYEPNGSILKAGAFKSVAEKFALSKLHANTHLYTSDALINDFPGRIFKTEVLLKADAKAAASYFPDRKVNVITRNYPLSPDELKKKLKLQDGGEQYLIACSGEKQKFLIAASRLK